MTKEQKDALERTISEQNSIIGRLIEDISRLNEFNMALKSEITEIKAHLLKRDCRKSS